MHGDAGDEGKPECRRCTDAKAECRYVVHLSFLDKNAWVLPADNNSGPASDSSATLGYSVVEVSWLARNLS